MPGPASSNHSEKWLQPSFQGQTASNQNLTSQKWIHKPPQEQQTAGGFVFPFQQTGYRSGQFSILFSLFQSPLIGSPAKQQMVTSPRPVSLTSL